MSLATILRKSERVVVKSLQYSHKMFQNSKMTMGTVEMEKKGGKTLLWQNQLQPFFDCMHLVNVRYLEMRT